MGTKQIDATVNLKKVISKGFNPLVPKIFPATMDMPQMDVERIGRREMPLNMLPNSG